MIHFRSEVSGDFSVLQESASWSLDPNLGLAKEVHVFCFLHFDTPRLGYMCNTRQSCPRRNIIPSPASAQIFSSTLTSFTFLMPGKPAIPTWQGSMHNTRQDCPRRNIIPFTA